MPSFNPPLAQTSLVPLPNASSGQSWVKLSFTTTFEDDEDTTGEWQVWTDVPSVDEHGKPLTKDGEWHAITFRPVPVSSSVSDDDTTSTPKIDSDGRIKLKVKDNPDESPDTITFQATAILEPHDGASYAYTFRRVTSPDSTQWLGGEGSNGVIRISAEAESSSSLETTEGEAEGFAVSFDTSGDSPPYIFLLPTERIITARFAVTSDVSRPPFVTAIKSPSDDPNRRVYTAVARPGLEHFDVSSEAPAEDAKHSHADSPSDALASLLDKVKWESIDVVKVTSNGKPASDVLAFTLTQGDRQFLAIYSSSRSAVRNVEVDLPSLQGGAPRALSAEGIDSFAFVPKDKVKLELSPGRTIAEILPILSFDQLPLQDGKKLLVLAPKAVSSELKQQEAGVPVSKSAENEAVDSGIDDTAMSVDSESEIEEIEEIESVPSDPEPQTQVVLRSAFWQSIVDFFKAIEGFIVRFWTWVLGPSGDDIEVEESEEPVDGDEVPTESTPLLSKSESLSRVASGLTADSGLNPSPTRNGKSSAKVVSETAKQAPVSASVQTAVGLGPSILYTFKTAPPFQFLLPPGSSSDELVFKNGNGVVAEPSTTVEENACVELELEVEGAGDSWEVSVEAR